MSRGLRSPKWTASSDRRNRKPGKKSPGLAARHRRLVCEPLEDRCLLSVASPQIDLLNASPALFARNEGQWADQSVRYAFNGAGANIAFTDAGLSFQAWQSSASDSTTTDTTPTAAFGESSDTTMKLEQFSLQFNGARHVAPRRTRPGGDGLQLLRGRPVAVAEQRSHVSEGGLQRSLPPGSTWTLRAGAPA